MDRFHPGARTAVSTRQRSFSRLAIGVAGAITAVGLALIGAAVNGLDLFETLGDETFTLAVGFALVLLGVIAIAAYAVVQPSNGLVGRKLGKSLSTLQVFSASPFSACCQPYVLSLAPHQWRRGRQQYQSTDVDVGRTSH